jgi:hypothetical protein
VLAENFGDELGLSLGRREPGVKLCDVARHGRNRLKVPFVEQSVAHRFARLGRQVPVPAYAAHDLRPVAPLGLSDPSLGPAGSLR